jgi:hypothetical protein
MVSRRVSTCVGCDMRTNDVRMARAALALGLLAYEFMSGGNLRLCSRHVNDFEQLPTHGIMLDLLDRLGDRR